jgi:hypothetical protein
MLQEIIVTQNIDTVLQEVPISLYSSIPPTRGFKSV